MRINRRRLRKELIEIYRQYLEYPGEENMKKKARFLYTRYMNASPLFSKELQEAVALLVDVGWDLPRPPKPSRKRVLDLIEQLRSE